IASAFLVASGTMSQRLVRAKAKIRDAGISFELPEAAELPDRLEAVLEAIYACYGFGWGVAGGVDEGGRGVVEEGLMWGRLDVDVRPDEREGKGLLALMLHCEARRPARRDARGAFVPLAAQDTSLWLRALMAEAETLLTAASRVNRMGHLQLEAAIQSAH